jgi:hypothetical protein
MGIGDNVALFTVARGVPFEPLGFQDPDRLVMLYEWGLQETIYARLKRGRSRCVQALAAVFAAGVAVTAKMTASARMSAAETLSSAEAFRGVSAVEMEAAGVRLFAR